MSFEAGDVEWGPFDTGVVSWVVIACAHTDLVAGKSVRTSRREASARLIVPDNVNSVWAATLRVGFASWMLYCSSREGLSRSA